MPPANPLLLATDRPAIPLIQAWAARYGNEHGPILDMCQAAPGYEPCAELLDRLAEEAGNPANARYGAILGDPLLRDAYARHSSDALQGRIKADQVAITAGCNQAFMLVTLAIAQRGDAILLPMPWYWNHKMTLDMLGVEARPLPCAEAEGFVPDVEAARTLISERVRALVLVTPNNPTGAVYPPATIAAFRDLCREHGIALILDETYRDFLPDGQERPHALFSDPDWTDTLIGLYSFSKAFGIPGHRLGAVTASSALMEQFFKALDCLHVCPQRPAQAAMAALMSSLGDWQAANRAAINRRGEALRSVVQDLPGWSVASQGAFCAFVRHPFSERSSAEAAEWLACRRGILCLPGSAFGEGQDAYLRFAFGGVEEAGILQLRRRLSEVPAAAQGGAGRR
ncbi:aminotransferase [Methylobacterium oxalidis]|uniref:aminotransferase n=1 Tax=Methylobacterium oxalidis TaxID=944322 RepID=UPI0011BEF232|nr:aminotransferase [Methylobacterium oxalidis]GJE35173.1 Histidinol-phosphate aminotransferase [Methylobacterium oxalidis]